jgi:ribosomal protein S18 acetylase RimI-like enzyme
MFPGLSQSLDNLRIRPARPEDSGFVEALYRSTRQDLLVVDAEADFIEDLVGMQYRAQITGYGEMFPDAMYFVVECMSAPIGRVVVDFGSNEVHLVDIALIPEARGQGYGTQILRILQRAAAQTRAPLTLTVSRTNPRARQVYLALGFRVEQGDAMVECMVWYPTSDLMHG